MAKIRHIAIRSEDVEQTVRFFTEVFGLELVQRRQHGPVDLSDGDVNITVLPLNVGSAGEVRPGFDHIGFSVEDEAEIRERLLARGASELNPVRLGDVYYESKFKSPQGLVIDVGHWAGASPVDRAAPAGAVANEPR
jgi:catechol 2,3-dioxygenase-like lactoylglutathione lyase family enzyme